MAGLGLAHAAAAIAQPAAAPRAGDSRIRLAQLLDTSPDQQEISRDYATGMRLAVNQFNRSASRQVQLVNIECDGSASAVSTAIRGIRSDASLCALIGTAGEALALASVETSRAEGLQIAHIAPWLSDTRFDRDRDVVPLFASREAQIRFALRSLESNGVSDIGLVYATERSVASLHPGVDAAAKSLSLRTQVYAPRAGEDVLAVAQRVSTASPAVMLFLGGTIELSQFTQALSQRRLHRYVVSLADIDVSTLMQLGAGRSLPLILTQVVPNPQTSALPAVRNYREQLKAQFDEKPSQISLAGYLAGCYALPVVARNRAPTRASLLAEFERREPEDIGGFSVGFSASQRRGSSYVTQTLLTGDGRLVG